MLENVQYFQQRVLITLSAKLGPGLKLKWAKAYRVTPAYWENVLQNFYSKTVFKPVQNRTKWQQ